MTTETFDCRLCQSTTPHIFYCRDCGRLYCGDHIDEEDHFCGSSVYRAALPNGSQYYFPVSGWRAAIVSRTSGRSSIIGRIASILFASPVTLSILLLIWVWFPIQMWLLANMGGISPGGELPAEWLRLFALDSTNMDYVWTWFTSVLSHGSLPHLLVNSIVLAMFGPLVERKLGSVAFAGLFVGGGVAAGLFQAGMAAAAGLSLPILGASGGNAAVLGTYASIEPDSKVYLFFVIPMSMGVAVFALIGGSYLIPLIWGVGAGGVAHLAHAFGATIGLLYGVVCYDSSQLRAFLSR